MTSQTITTGQPEVGTEESNIRALIAARVSAMRQSDADALVALFAADVVKFDLAPPLEVSGARARDADGLRSWFSGFDGPVDYDVTELAVQTTDDLAFGHSLNRLSATPRGTTEPFELWFRATVCLRKVAGRWLIVHEHNSTPFYMDGSLRAAVDLRP